MKLYGHNQANCRSPFIFALHCKKAWRLLIRGAPGVTYKGDGVTYKGDGLLIRRGPPCEWVSRTEMRLGREELGRTTSYTVNGFEICAHALAVKSCSFVARPFHTVGKPSRCILRCFLDGCARARLVRRLNALRLRQHMNIYVRSVLHTDFENGEWDGELGLRTRIWP